MENTKNWKDIYEEYKEAVGRKFDESLLQELMTSRSELQKESRHVWDGCFDRLSVGCLTWKGTNVTFTIPGIDKWENNWVINSEILRSFKGGNLFEVMDKISRKLVTQLGWWIGNTHDRFALSDANRALSDIDESVRKIDPSFCSDVCARVRKEYDLSCRIREVTEQIEFNDNRPSVLWNQMVRAWRDQELLKTGTKIDWYGTIAKVTEKTVLFDNGCRKNIDNIDYGRIFHQKHPEIERTHSTSRSWNV